MCDCANPILLGDVYKGSCCCLCILSTDITHQRPDMCRTLLGGWVCSSTLCVLFHIECNAKHGHSRGIDCQRFFNSSKCFNLFDNYKKNFIVKIVYIHKFSSPSPAWDSTIPLTSGNKKKKKKKRIGVRHHLHQHLLIDINGLTLHILLDPKARDSGLNKKPRPWKTCLMM